MPEYRITHGSLGNVEAVGGAMKTTLVGKLRGMRLPGGFNPRVLWDAADTIERLTRERDETKAELAALYEDAQRFQATGHRLADENLRLRERMAVCPQCGSTTHYKYPDPPDKAFVRLHAKYETVCGLLESALPVVQASAQGYAPPEQDLVTRITAALEGR